MLALTLWPEWAFAIAHLGKSVENRSPRFAAQIAKRVGSGWLAIHAGVKRPADFTAVAFMAWGADPTIHFDVRGSYRAPTVAQIGDITITDDVLTRRAIVALVKLGDVLPPGITAAWKVDDSAALPFTDVFVLAEPIPCKGAQGLWTPTPDVQARLRAALETT